MKTYVIGDVQGCQPQLEMLIEKIEQKTTDARYWFAGDLVNRGPFSLETLRFVKGMGKKAVTVMGNHDLHLLAIAAGVRKSQKLGVLEPVLKASDSVELIDWLRMQPMAYLENNHLLVHAGVLPQWNAALVMELAHELESVLRGSQWKEFMREMYGDEPAQWHDNLEGAERLRCIVNGLTRLRFCTEDGVMDFDAKEGLDDAPKGFIPWFDVKNRQTQDVTVAFGHWSTLGLVLRPNLIALDTGCVWGGKLTAVCLEDRSVVQVDCQGFCTPGAS